MKILKQMLTAYILAKSSITEDLVQTYASVSSSNKIYSPRLLPGGAFFILFYL